MMVLASPPLSRSHAQFLVLVVGLCLQSCVVAFAPFAPLSQRVGRSSCGDIACRTPLKCSWGGEVDWKQAKVLENKPAAEGLSSIILDAGEVAAGFISPGQFVQLKTGSEKPGFFAIANGPGTMGDNMEFLIKGTDSNGWLTGAKDGSSLDISPIMGKGFPVKDEFEGYKYDFPVQNLILLCTGTGIAPIRSVIESSILEVETTGPFGRSCTLYYGCRSPSTMAYKDLLLEWEERGITVVPVMSRPGKETWNGRTGYVQQALKEDGVRIPRNTGALLVGQKEMAEESKAILASAGVFEGRILTNF